MSKENDQTKQRVQAESSHCSASCELVSDSELVREISSGLTFFIMSTLTDKQGDSDSHSSVPHHSLRQLSFLGLYIFPGPLASCLVLLEEGQILQLVNQASFLQQSDLFLLVL